MKIKLIINADDFGLTKGVSLGILDAIEKGIVTSTTAMVNGLYFDQGMEQAKKRKIGPIGIHLTMTWGKPILPKEKVSTLVDSNGYFLRNTAKNVDYNQVTRELTAQIEKFLLYKSDPTHLDGHHHFFTFDKRVMEIVLKLAKNYQLPLRSIDSKARQIYKNMGIKTTQTTVLDFYDKNITESSFINLLEKHRKFESVELMCHPAYLDDDLKKNSSYSSQRVMEYQTLTSSTVKDYIDKNDIQLKDFSSL